MRYLTKPALTQPDRAINHVISYGQSLSNGWEGWPALSLNQPFDSLMLGDSVRPADEQAPYWVTAGPAQFRPLVATNQSNDGVLLDPALLTRMPRDATVLGETVLEAALAEWRGRLRPSHPPRKLLASAAGVGGRSIEALSKGAQPELFERLRGCARLARTLAAGDYGITALLWLQGENNAWGLDGATAETAEYKALFTRLLADFDTDIVHAVAGQSALPAVFTYQTGGAYSTDHMGVSQAQLELALEHPRVFMAGPTYPVTDKGGHLDANGYRWLGAQFGRVMHKVITLGEDWQPLHPVSARLSGTQLRVDFHVPCPPLACGPVYSGTTTQLWDDRGFLVSDDAGRIGIASVTLGETHAVITLQRPPGPGALLRYACRSAHGGRGNLHDSETAIARDCYEYNDQTGHRPEANIAALVGQNYKLMNWCVAFRMEIITKQM